jgi:hypothetical protein
VFIALIAALGRCASPDLCPSDDELLAAVSRRDNERTAQVGNALRAEDPNSIIMVHSERIVRISHVHCDKAYDNDPRSVNCAFRVSYPSSTVQEVAKLSRDDQGWVIVTAMTVTLSRRNVR